jgi:hypothetical protein
MVFTDDITDHTRRLFVRLVVVIAQLAHCVQHAPMNRFQAIADIRQGSSDDYAHGVIQVGLLHLIFEAYGQQFLCNFTHGCIFSAQNLSPIPVFERNPYWRNLWVISGKIW